MTDAFDRLRNRDRRAAVPARDTSLTRSADQPDLERFCRDQGVSTGDLLEALYEQVLTDPEQRDRLVQSLRQREPRSEALLLVRTPRHWLARLNELSDRQGEPVTQLIQQALAEFHSLDSQAPSLRQDLDQLRSEVEQLKRKLAGW